MYTEDIYNEALIIMLTYFVIPFLFVGFRHKLFRNFNLPNFVKALNKTLLVYAVICVLFVVLMAISSYFSENYLHYYKFLQKGGNILPASFYFFVIATIIFFYPALVVFRLINYLASKQATSSSAK